MRVNAAGALVPEKAKYQLVRSLCSAAGSGQHVVQNTGVADSSSEVARQMFDYAALGAWMEALRHQRPLAEWEPPVHAPLSEPPPLKRRRKGGAKETAAVEGPAARGSADEALSARAALPETRAVVRGQLDASTCGAPGSGLEVLQPEEAVLCAFTPHELSPRGSDGHAAFPPLAGVPPAALLVRGSPEPPDDGGAGKLKLTELHSATCSTTSGASSPTASAGVEGHDAAGLQPMDASEEPPAADSNTPRPSKESARGYAPAEGLDPKLRHIDAAEVLDARGRFARWAP